MCVRCEDSIEVDSKNVDRSSRRTLVVLVLFSVTISALGISCFALLTVQNLSRDLDSLRSVLKRSRLETTKQHAYEFSEKAHLAVGPIYETPLGTNSGTQRKPQRRKRHLDFMKNDENSGLNILHDDTIETKITTSTVQKAASTINKENGGVRTHPDKSAVESNRANESENIGNSPPRKADTTNTSIENVESISNIHEPPDEIPTVLKESVEFLDSRKKNITKKHTLFFLNQNPDIPSLIEEIDSQRDHHVQKKAADYDDDVESFTPEYRAPRRRPQRGRTENQLEIIDEFSPQAGRLKSLTAIHLDGDTSQYMLGVHTNYKGNGHLRHAQKTFIDWKVSDWVETISANHHFHLRNGVVTVKDSGIYFIYAQIYYLDEHDSNGYLVLRNSDKILQCKVTTPSSERQLKGNTCYTGAVFYLEANDKISVDDISNGRYTLFVPGYSFFGMIKLGDVKGK